jgi:ribosomal protein S18 acetylase RimI-like enzyme
MAVDPSSQGAGLAGLLLDAAEQHFRSRGCSRVTLDTTAPLTRAIRFYERQGYRHRNVLRDGAVRVCEASVTPGGS